MTDPFKYVPSTSANPPHYTTNYGAPVWNNTSSLTLGNRGPILLEDYYLIEKLAQFDRERIPERVVHARGTSAKGFFECTRDISHLTCADPFKSVGQRTPLIVRFSTVVHERQSPETLRDPRGFAIKFYTREGNWDLVGNNMPVFFIRDGINFPDMVHAFKPNPVNHQQENWRIWDFFMTHPECCHMFTFLLDDVGIPKDYRHMPGFGVHTYKLLTREGRETFVKFHWIPKCGVESLMDEEAVIVGGTNHSHATKDLYDAIEAGDYPEWTLAIQTMNPEDEDKFDFDPLDVTKTWPEDQFPLQEVGRMVLNKNCDNFFTESEQLAFCPGLIIPGIHYSDDKLLQTRIFSYSDTQRHRLGANYLQLPVNAPRCLYRENHNEGASNFAHKSGHVNYNPSSHDPVKMAAPTPMPSSVVCGERLKKIIEKENNFFQAGERFRSFDKARQERFIKRLADTLVEPRVTNQIRKHWIETWSKCDEYLGERLSELVPLNAGL